MNVNNQVVKCRCGKVITYNRQNLKRRFFPWGDRRDHMYLSVCCPRCKGIIYLGQQTPLNAMLHKLK